MLPRITRSPWSLTYIRVCRNDLVPIGFDWGLQPKRIFRHNRLLAINPYKILDVGLQLSYGGTIGIILFNKKLNRKLYKLPKKIREGISVSISSPNTQIFPVNLSIVIPFYNISAVAISPFIADAVTVPADAR